jgi:type II secretory pathway pseudopilin PulG
LDDRGYILVALLVGIAVAGVWMAALLPAWRQQMTREREAELVFRGEQYARAIWLYSLKNNGALPTNLDDLVSQHVLRRRWKDPIANDEFLPKIGCVTAGVAPGGGLPRGGGPGAGPGGGRGGPGAGGTAPRGGAPAPAPPAGPGGGGRRGGVLEMELFQAPVRGGPVLPPPTQGGGPTGGGPVPLPPRGGGPVPVGGQGGQPGVPPTGGRGTGVGTGGQGTQPGAAPTGGICGVQSKSNKQSIRIYNGQQEYDLWQFDITTAQLHYQQSVVRLGGAAGGGGMSGFGGGAGGGGTGNRGGRGAQGNGPGAGRGTGPAGTGAPGPGRGGTGPNPPGTFNPTGVPSPGGRGRGGL